MLLTLFTVCKNVFKIPNKASIFLSLLDVELCSALFILRFRFADLAVKKHEKWRDISIAGYAMSASVYLHTTPQKLYGEIILLKYIYLFIQFILRRESAKYSNFY